MTSPLMPPAPDRITVITESTGKRLTQTFTAIRSADLNVGSPAVEVPWGEATQHIYREMRHYGDFDFVLSIKAARGYTETFEDIPEIATEYEVHLDSGQILRGLPGLADAERTAEIMASPGENGYQGSRIVEVQRRGLRTVPAQQVVS